MTIESQTEQSGVFRQIVRVDAHTFHADVGPDLGGGASAPSPHDYFDGALATCKALTVAWYAKKHGMKLDRVESRVEREDAHEREGKYVLRVRMQYVGALSDAERARLHDIATRCPVHKLMTAATIEIETAPLDA